MAFGDPPVNHGHMEGSSATTTSFILTWATTAGNTLIIAMRRGGTALGTTTVTVSWDGGTTFPSTTTLVNSHLVATAGGLLLFYLPNITGATANNTVVKITFDVAQTCRPVVVEYPGQYLADLSASADNGSTTAIDSGAITTTKTTVLIGAAITGINGSPNCINSAPFTPGTSGVTWAVADELDHVLGTGTGVACVVCHRSGAGTSGAGTYHLVGTLNAADNTGGVVASFTDAGGAVDPFPAGYGQIRRQLETNAIYKM